jgi:hypothetical protein
MYLHAGTGQDVKQAYRPGKVQSARPAELIPAGTIVPVRLDSTLRSDKSRSGATILGTVMQDVPLGRGETLRKGSKVSGHVVVAITPGKGSDESRISFEFDQVHLGNLTIPITTNLRAVASRIAVLAATPELTSSENADSQVQIGGDQISYGTDGPVMVGSRVVGKYTSQGVLAHSSDDLSTSCRGASQNTGLPQAFWLFSVNACVAYGFGDLTIFHSGSTTPIGEITLTSNGKAAKVGRGGGMLLRVEGSRPGEAQARTISSQETGQ